MPETKLKPCPFCGALSEEIGLKSEIYHGNVESLHGEMFWYVECMPCDAMTGHCFDGDASYYGFKSGKDVAIAHWNRRTPKE